MPEEFSVTVELPADIALATMADALYLIQDFALNHYRENLFMDVSWEKFAALPGEFEFLCEDALPLVVGWYNGELRNASAVVFSKASISMKMLSRFTCWEETTWWKSGTYPKIWNGN